MRILGDRPRINVITAPLNPFPSILETASFKVWNKYPFSPMKEKIRNLILVLQPNEVKDCYRKIMYLNFKKLFVIICPSPHLASSPFHGVEEKELDVENMKSIVRKKIPYNFDDTNLFVATDEHDIINICNNMNLAHPTTFMSKRELLLFVLFGVCFFVLVSNMMVMESLDKLAQKLN